ncbi:MAG TPA: ROK family protein [Aggregatilineaceae bacterium]|nr:ROK family protein [Aggregatilineaceae bacterium]
MTKPAPIALGIDMGGSYTKIGLVSVDGEISAFRRIAMTAKGTDAQSFLDELSTQGREVRAAALGTLLGIGISTHGCIGDARRGPVVCANTPALRGLVENAFELPVVVNNDLTAHALAEYHYGSGRGARRFLCMAIGTGLGAGVVINGDALRFVGGNAGDTGRVIAEPGGPPDMYGARGSTEALCGIRGVERLALSYYGQPVAATDVIRAARDGTDDRAVRVMRQIGAYLVQALAMLCSIYLPDKVALTGGTAEAGPVLFEACCQRFDALVAVYHRAIAESAPGFYSGVKIVLGEMRGETGMVGATVEIFQTYAGTEFNHRMHDSAYR